MLLLLYWLLLSLLLLFGFVVCLFVRLNANTLWRTFCGMQIKWRIMSSTALQEKQQFVAVVIAVTAGVHYVFIWLAWLPPWVCFFCFQLKLHTRAAIGAVWPHPRHDISILTRGHDHLDSGDAVASGHSWRNDDRNGRCLYSHLDRRLSRKTYTQLYIIYSIYKYMGLYSPSGRRRTGAVVSLICVVDVVAGGVLRRPPKT